MSLQHYITHCVILLILYFVEAIISYIFQLTKTTRTAQEEIVSLRQNMSTQARRREGRDTPNTVAIIMLFLSRQSYVCTLAALMVIVLLLRKNL